MRFIHIADTHLGISTFNNLDVEGMNLRERLIYENFLQGVDQIIREKPDVLIHAGDLFDQVRPKTRAYTTVLEALDRLQTADIPLVVIAGNHSMVKTRYTTSPFEVLTYHPSHITAAYSFRYEKVEIGDTIFHLIPNMLQPRHYRIAFDQIETDPGHHHVLVTHGLAHSIRDKRLATVAEYELDNTILSNQFAYIALGHYHNQTQITGNAWYSGSAEYFTYGEIADTKGGLLVDLSRDDVHHITLPCTPMIDLGTISCDGVDVGEITSEIISRIEHTRLPPHAMVQVTLAGLCREHGRGPDMRELIDIQKQLLNLKIRVWGRDEDHPVSTHQDLKTIDYLGEYSSFIDKHQFKNRQKEFVRRCGLDVLKTVMGRHQEMADDH